MGVRGQLATSLLVGAEVDALEDWIPRAKDPNWSSRWCLVEVLKKHHPEAPRLNQAFTPEDIEEKAKPILDWYQEDGRSSR